MHLLGHRQKVAVAPSPTGKTMASFFETYPLSSILPYETYDPESGLYLNKRSAGFVLEASPLTGANEEMVKILASLLADTLPTGCDVHCLLRATPTIGAHLDRWRATREKSGALLKAQAAYRHDYLTQGAFHSLSEAHSFLLRDFRLLLSVSLPARAQKTQALSEQLIQLRDDVTAACRSLPLFVQPVPVASFIATVRDHMYPRSHTQPTPATWNPYHPLSEQLTDPEIRLKVLPHALQFQTPEVTHEVRTLSVCEYPAYWPAWKMTDLIGDLINNALQLPCPFALSFSIHVLEREKAKAKTEIKFLSRDAKMRSPAAKFLPTLSREHADWQWVRERLTDGDKLVKTFFQVLLFTTPQAASTCESKVKHVFEAKGWKLRNTRYLALQSWLASLPMMMSEGLVRDLSLAGRLRTLPSFTAANLMPLQGEFKGTPTPAMLLAGDSWPTGVLLITRKEILMWQWQPAVALGSPSLFKIIYCPCSPMGAGRG